MTIGGGLNVLYFAMRGVTDEGAGTARGRVSQVKPGESAAGHSGLSPPSVEAQCQVTASHGKAPTGRLGVNKKWHPQGESNPCFRDENPMS